MSVPISTMECAHCKSAFQRATNRLRISDTVGGQFFCSQRCATRGTAATRAGKLRTDPLTRLMANVRTTDGCWEWLAAKNAAGYGVTSFRGKQSVIAHRAFYELFVGQIPSGLYCCHHCDNPSCVRPDHLFLGTPRDNMVDKVRKGRLRNQNSGKTHCIRGHELTPENTKLEKNGRRCISCERLKPQSVARITTKGLQALEQWKKGQSPCSS